MSVCACTKHFPTTTENIIIIFLHFQFTDYQEVCKGYGGKGLLVSEDSADLSSILKTAQSLCREGHTVLINSLIGSSKFREGSISV